MSDNSWLVPGARAWLLTDEQTRAPVELAQPCAATRARWNVWLSDGDGECVAVEHLTPRPAESATEPEPTELPVVSSSPTGSVAVEPRCLIVTRDGIVAEDSLVLVASNEAPTRDACTLCGVLLADESDVEAGYVTAFARDPADPTRCLSHGRTSLGASRG